MPVSNDQESQLSEPPTDTQRNGRVKKMMAPNPDALV
jgi:hypothetical protein